MKNLLLPILFLLCANSLKAQLHLDDENYIYRDQAGNTLTDRQVDELLHSKQHFRLAEQEADGKTIVRLLPISNSEFRKIIRDKKKLAHKMAGTVLPAFTAEDRQGRPVSEKDFVHNGITVYNFWFTTCPHCLEEIPKLNKLVTDYETGILFLAPTFNTSTQVAKFLENYSFNYTIITHAKGLAEKMHIRSYPAHYIVDSKGIIRKIITGSSDRVIRKLRRHIDKLKKEEQKCFVE